VTGCTHWLPGFPHHPFFPVSIRQGCLAQRMPEYPCDMSAASRRRDTLYRSDLPRGVILSRRWGEYGVMYMTQTAREIVYIIFTSALRLDQSSVVIIIITVVKRSAQPILMPAASPAHDQRRSCKKTSAYPGKAKESPLGRAALPGRLKQDTPLFGHFGKSTSGFAWAMLRKGRRVCW